MDRTPFLKASYTSKAHYMLYSYSKENLNYTNLDYVIRGFKKNETIKFQNPIYDLLLAMLNEELNFILKNDGVYEDMKI